jgi:hypothetical protein
MGIIFYTILFTSVKVMLTEVVSSFCVAGQKIRRAIHARNSLLGHHRGERVERWCYILNGLANAFDRAAAVSVDGAGEVVAAGGTSNAGTPFWPRPDFTVVKPRGTDGGDF